MAPTMYHRSEFSAWEVKPRNLAREREIEDAARRAALMRACKHKFPGLPVWLPGNFVTEFEKADMSVPPVAVEETPLTDCLMELHRRDIDVARALKSFEEESAPVK